VTATAPKVSVCVPVFDAAAWLPQCLESLQAQTLRDLEIVAVDDGSRDASPAILDRLARGDARIVVSSQPNRGAGAARNAALAMARGEFVAFIDADDWLEPDCLAALHDEARSSSSDLVACDYVVHPEQSRRRPFVVPGAPPADGKVAYLRAVLAGRVAGFAWNKLYRRDLLLSRGIAFPVRDEMVIMEDQCFTLAAAHAAERLGFVRRPLVHHRVHPASLVQRYQPSLFRDQTELYRRTRAFRDAERGDDWPLAELQRAHVRGVFMCVLNEVRPTNPRPLRERLAAIAAMGQDAAFRAAYDDPAVRRGVPLKFRAVLAPLRRAPLVTHLLARVYARLSQRRAA